METRDKLVMAVMAYDRKQEGKKGYNPYAMPMYLKAVDSAMADVTNGVKIRKALVGNFCGRLLDILLKTVGELPSTDEEQRF